MSSEEELTIISDASAIIISNLDVRRMLHDLVKELKKAADINWAAIVRVEGASISYLAQLTDSTSTHEIDDSMPIKGTAYELLITQKATVVEPNITKESRFVNNKYYIKHGIKSVVYLPLQRDDKLTGCVTLASRKPNSYNPRFISILERLTPLIAVQIENVCLLNEAVEMARIDELTGLHNRRALNEMAMNEIKRCSRYGGTFSLVILDIDTLKPVNDTYGHLFGDDVLKKFASCVSRKIRPMDKLARYGGEEFAIILPETDISNAMISAERVRKFIEEKTHLTVGGETINITASFGVACYPGDASNTDDLVSIADKRLYFAKRAGRNQICGPE